MSKQYRTAEEMIEHIDELIVADLRELADMVGVVPGNRKRADLIERILAVTRGEAEPEKRKKSGRPRKNSSSFPNNGSDPDAEQQEQSEQPQSNRQPGQHEARSQAQSQQTGAGDAKMTSEGILEVMPDGYGFLRTHNYSNTLGKDFYVTANMISRMKLVSGDKLKVALRQYPDRQAPTAVFVEEINDQPCLEIRRTPFDTLEPCFPNERINLRTDRTDYSLRVLDLVAPIGKGQRGLIVAPPKTGKTILLKKLAMAVRKNHPEIHLTVLLIDERPEEVTDFKESVDCDVVYSTFDQQPSNHCRIAELVFTNARRRVEQGQDVMILLDSITRLGRAYNQIAEQTGRTLTGGLDIAALQEPKKMFGAGRNVRGGGSLTILATALIDTGSRMDDIIYEEFKGTGNMEIQLDRRMSEKRIFPAVDLNRSGTRREELLLNQNQLEGMYLVRRMLSREDALSATEELLEVVMTTENNDETIDTLKRLLRSAEARRAMKK